MQDMNRPEMLTHPNYTCRLTSWQQDKDKLQCVRYAVFVEEQQIPADLEWDEKDKDAIHVIAVNDSDQPVATGRLLADGQIGRMAVLAEWRGKGVGRSILNLLLAAAHQRGVRIIKLSSQQTACGFYLKQGFIQTGDPYQEAERQHVAMHLQLGDNHAQQTVS